jgi:hypothetical protein
MPWETMSRGSAPSNANLLLDYVSPWNVIAMFHALKSSHYVVAITIFGSLLVKVLTIASTGLFLLQSITLGTSGNLRATFVTRAKFDGSTYDSSRVDASAALTVLGANVLNLTLPQGTTDQHAFQPFGLQSSTPRKYTMMSLLSDYSQSM